MRVPWPSALRLSLRAIVARDSREVGVHEGSRRCPLLPVVELEAPQPSPRVWAIPAVLARRVGDAHLVSRRRQGVLLHLPGTAQRGRCRGKDAVWEARRMCAELLRGKTSVGDRVLQRGCASRCGAACEAPALSAARGRRRCPTPCAACPARSCRPRASCRTTPAARDAPRKGAAGRLQRSIRGLAALLPLVSCNWAPARKCQKQAHGASNRALRRAETRACALLGVPSFCAGPRLCIAVSWPRTVAEPSSATVDV